MIPNSEEEQAIRILQRCFSLTDAETKLAKMTPVPVKPFRWGVWDGWTGMPPTLAGLGYEEKVKKDYNAGYVLGEGLAQKARSKCES